MTAVVISPEQARRYLVAQAGLCVPVADQGHAGAQGLLARLRCIQLDPLDRIGTNADLVALARVDGLAKGDIYDAVLPGHGFEHFAKERCLLPASAFPYYRARGVATPWWRAGARQQRLDEGILADVLAEVTARGPVALAHLTDRGRVEALDWSGWKGTGKVTTMALEVLWRRCAIVVCGRSADGKVFDVPARALPEVASAPAPETFEAWAVRERTEACGLLSRASGPWWSVLYEVRTTDVPDALVAKGELEEVVVTGSRRTYLAPAGFRDRPVPDDDGRMRILGPLDPLIWDRKLVEHVFGFTYVWEVYKPAAKRQWGWYVCPLLHRGALVGRIDARVADGRLVVERVWRETPDFDDEALDMALARHAAALGVDAPGT